MGLPFLPHYLLLPVFEAIALSRAVLAGYENRKTRVYLSTERYPNQVMWPQGRSKVLEFNVSYQQQVAVVGAQGRIDSSTAGQLGEVLSQVIEDGHTQLVLDIGGVDYMSSAGLRELVTALKKLRAKDGDMRIAQVSERVYEVLELSGLSTIFEIFKDPTEAANSF
jgi:anti-sigma B factor antagonist